MCLFETNSELESQRLDMHQVYNGLIRLTERGSIYVDNEKSETDHSMEVPQARAKNERNAKHLLRRNKSDQTGKIEERSDNSESTFDFNSGLIEESKYLV